MSRTIANSTETVLLLLGLYIWYRPLSKRRKSHPKVFHAYQINSHAKPISFLQIQYLIPAISSYARPTITAFWVPMIINSLTEQINFIRTRPNFRYMTVFKLLFGAINTIIIGCMLCFTVDILTYEAVTCTPFNFFVTNILQNEASRFGVSNWHWYFSQGLPIMLGLYTPLFVMSIWRGYPRKLNGLLQGAAIFAMSLCISPHKEFRFLMPIIPILHMFIAWYLMYWDNLATQYSFSSQKEKFMEDMYDAFSVFDIDGNGSITKEELQIVMTNVGDPPSDEEAAAMVAKYDIDGNGSIQFDEFLAMMNEKRTETHEEGMLTLADTEPKFVARSTFFAMNMLHVAIALYFCTFHQAGTESAANFIAKHIHHRGIYKDASHKLPTTLEIHYLAPCHAFPGMSFLHNPSDQVKNIIIQSPDCSPGQQISDSKQFEYNPVSFYIEKISSNPISEWNIPEYVATFDVYAERLEHLLISSKIDSEFHQKMPSLQYKMIKSYLHSHFQYDMDDPHHKKKVYIYQRLS